MEVLRRMAQTNHRIFRVPGNYWTVLGTPNLPHTKKYAQVPEWFVRASTIQALEKRGWVARKEGDSWGNWFRILTPDGQKITNGVG